MTAALRPRSGRPALFRTFTMKTVCVITLFVRIAVSACLFAAVPRAFSQPYCKVRTFTIDDGLAANNISEFGQSPDGMMWVSTWNGLCNYDGYGFSKFRDRHGSGQVLTSNRIKFIRPDVCGDIWCSTYDGNAWLFDCNTCRFIDVGRIIRKQYPVEWTTRNILSVGNGYAWILGKENINFRIDERRIKGEDGITLIDTEKTRYKGSIRKVMTDARGREWVFASNGVSLYGSRVHLPHRFEYMCQQGRDIFFASKAGLFGRYDGRLEMIALPGGISKINSMRKVGGSLVMATDRGVMFYDPRRRSSRLVSVQHPSQPSAAVTDIFIDSRRRVWAFAGGPGVTLIEGGGSRVSWLQSAAAGWMGTYSRDPMFHEDGNRTVWVVPEGGVFSYYDDGRRELVPYNLNADNNNRLPVSLIVKYKKDTQNNLWFTGNHNLTLVSFDYYRFLFTSTVADDDTRSVMRRADGSLWTGMHGGFVTVHDAGRNLIGYLGSDGRIGRKPVRLAAEGVYAMHEDRSGMIWIGTKGGGILTLTPGGRGYRVSRFRRSSTDRWSVSCDSIYGFCEDGKGRMWVATYGGGINLVSRGKDGGMVFINGNNVLGRLKSDAYNKVRRLTAVAGGVMIASTSGGIVTFSLRDDAPGGIRYYYTSHVPGDTTSLQAADVLHTYFSPSSGLLYAATLGGGLQVADGGSLLRDGIPFRSVGGIEPDEGTVQSVAEDSRGNIWLVRESTVDRLDQKTGHCEIYGSDDWREDIGFTEAQPAVTSGGSVITLGVIGGCLTFRPGSITKSRYKPLIVFSGVQFQGDRQVTPILGRAVLDIPAGERNATIYFSALDYKGNRLIRYAYKIKELDREWNYTGTAHSASLSHIPAGRYTLVVKSTNADGVWADNEKQLRIYVHPTFWETGWAWLLYVVTASGIIYALLYVWRLRNNVAMEKLMKERQLKFFTDISHQLRTPLTLIDGPVRQVLDEEPLSARARTYLEFVRTNAGRMLSLVNKALDLKRLKGQDDGLQTAAADVLTDGARHAVPPSGAAVAAFGGGEERIRLLVVEDNDELRYFLVSTLAADYNVIEARDGQEGLGLALREQPDFIITDIMMPVMDGMTMIRRIKADPGICHIPIVVLSARTADNYRIEGLNEGIDDYITKPFSVQYLKSRVDNIIRQRRRLQQAYVDRLRAEGAGFMPYADGTPQFADADKAFTKRLIDWLDGNISDPELKIDDIAHALGMSRTVMYGKVKSLFGMSPIDFVRHVRIMKAERLIAGSRMSFAEIAYSVGFADPKYFGRTFKAKTGLTPSEYRKKRTHAPFPPEGMVD